MGDTGMVTVEHIAAFIVGVLAIGRMARLIVEDDFPPVVWLREKYVMTVPEKWAGLVECPFCISVHLAYINVTFAFVMWTWFDDWLWLWWWPNLVAASAYLAAMVVARDIPPE